MRHDVQHQKAGLDNHYAPFQSINIFFADLPNRIHRFHSDNAQALPLRSPPYQVWHKRTVQQQQQQQQQPQPQ
jgi:hypothetical protein